MAQTVDQVFASKKLWQWYNSPVTQHFDNVSEKGQDYSTAYGTPVAVPVGGRIVRSVHNNNDINDVVELQAIDGAVWLYQHITAKVSVGDTLQCGSVIGTENGLPIGQYSTGPHIEVRYCPPTKWDAKLASWYEPWINPASVFSSIGTQTAGTVAFNDPFAALSGNAPGGNSFSNPLSPNSSVTESLAWLDRQLALTNPFVVNPSPSFTVLGATVPDPIGYAQDVAVNFAYDMHALVWRVVLIALGVFILYKVVYNFIDIGAIVQTGTNAVSGVIQGATMLA